MSAGRRDDCESFRRLFLGGGSVIIHVANQTPGNIQCAVSSGLQSPVEATVTDCPASDGRRGHTVVGGELLNLENEIISGHSYYKGLLSPICQGTFVAFAATVTSHIN